MTCTRIPPPSRERPFANTPPPPEDPTHSPLKTRRCPQRPEGVPKTRLQQKTGYVQNKTDLEKTLKTE